MLLAVKVQQLLDNHSSTGDDNAHHDTFCIVREQDRYMPIANVIRIMRRILPPHAKIADDAKETIQECVSEYISFITSEANDRCQKEQRKTITAEDVLWAMGKLGFDEYVAPLTLFMQRYREFEGERSTARTDHLVKHTMEMPPMGAVGYAPTFHVAPHQGPLAPPIGPGPYYKQQQDVNQNQNQNQQGQGHIGCFDPYGHYR
ncbi:Nuclear transcription factor y subunit b-6 [Thalictrum thalictroides]|uniref:Nuclear transcription factor y subunit b-6 n=1 Tax=Thalictrum thalictroides TaxID=46969 RepID=A0A7J6WP69_THATH|nr:Nuclear transcription factor y subunit b-6 [Thalictrum thalictroides]